MEGRVWPLRPSPCLTAALSVPQVVNFDSKVKFLKDASVFGKLKARVGVGDVFCTISTHRWLIVFQIFFAINNHRLLGYL